MVSSSNRLIYVYVLHRVYQDTTVLKSNLALEIIKFLISKKISLAANSKKTQSIVST